MRKGEPYLRQRSGRAFGKRQVDCKHATPAGKIAELNITAVRLDRVSRNRKTQSETRTVLPVPVREWTKKISVLGDAAALILDLNCRAEADRACSQDDVATGP